MSLRSEGKEGSQAAQSSVTNREEELKCGRVTCLTSCSAMDDVHVYRLYTCAMYMT